MPATQRPPPAGIVATWRRVDQRLGVACRRLREQRVDVGVLVGQHGLHDGVERRVELLRVLVRLGDEVLGEDAVE